MKTKKLIILIIAIAVAMSMVLMCGCEKGGSTSNAGKIVKETADSLTIIDQAEREVTIAKDIKTIATSYRVTIRPLISLGVGDKIVGVGKTEEFFFTLQPSLKKAQDVGKGLPDLEELAKINPSVYFYKADDKDGLESVQELGIPAIGLSFETDEEVKTALNIMGAILGKTEKADELNEYYAGKIAKDEELTADIKDKKTAIVMGSTLGTVADGTMLQGHMIEAAGGINSAADLKEKSLWPTVGQEQIFEWNPDFIFISSSAATNYTPEDIYKNKAWSELTAVKEKHVYTIPAVKDSWEFPGTVSAIGIDFMMSKMYPEKMSTAQLQKNVDEFYKLSYGKTFKKEEIGY